MQDKECQIFDTKYGKIKLLKKVDSRRSLFVFLDTGYEVVAYNDNVKVGKVRDHTKEKVFNKELLSVQSDLNEVIQTNSYGELVILSRYKESCVVRFTETGTTLKVLYQNAKNGKVRDPYKVNKYGGRQGEFKKTPYWQQANQLWRNMLKRCYSQVDEKGYFGRCFVDERWKTFANFLEDLPKLENFDKWLLGHKEGHTKYNLDKDSILFGNDTYCKELCMFLDEHTNKSRTSKTHSWLEANGIDVK